jgi:hypothetical protein
MATAQHWHAPHVQVPHLHVHAPHLDWHDLEHPLRAAVAAVALMAAMSVAGAGLYSVNGISQLPLSGFTTSAAEPSVTWPSRELPREWRWERKAVSFDHMYGAHARGPSVDDMVRRAR